MLQPSDEVSAALALWGFVLVVGFASTAAAWPRIEDRGPAVVGAFSCAVLSFVPGAVLHVELTVRLCVAAHDGSHVRVPEDLPSTLFAATGILLGPAGLAHAVATTCRRGLVPGDLTLHVAHALAWAVSAVMSLAMIVNI